MIKGKIRLLLLAGIFGLIFTNAQAQTQLQSGETMLYVNDLDRDSDNGLRRGSFVGHHELGDQLTEKLDKVEEAYVYYKQGTGAYAQEERIVRKPRIYKALKKLDRYYIKQVKREKISIVNAATKLEKIFEVGLLLVKYDTRQVEKDLRKIKKAEDIEEYLLSLKFAK